MKIDDANLLFFQDVPVKPRVEGNSFLSFEGKFEFPNYDLVLVQDTGGTACPAEYYVIKVSRGGAVPSKSFGTCSDLIHVTRMKEGLLVSMPGFMGPFEGRHAQAKAAKQKFAYAYRDGAIVEKRIK